MQLIQCEVCGQEYPSAFSFEGVGIIELSENSTQCPRCGHMNGELEGVFTFDSKGVATFLSQRGVSREVLLELQQLVDDTRANPEKLSTFKQSANAIAPSLLLGDALEIFCKGHQFTIVTLGVLATVIYTVFTGISTFRKTPDTAPIPNNINIYNVLSERKSQELRRIQASPPVKGTNKMLPKKKRKR